MVDAGKDREPKHTQELQDSKAGWGRQRQERAETRRDMESGEEGSQALESRGKRDEVQRLCPGTRPSIWKPKDLPAKKGQNGI